MPVEARPPRWRLATGLGLARTGLAGSAPQPDVTPQPMSASRTRTAVGLILLGIMICLLAASWPERRLLDSLAKAPTTPAAGARTADPALRSGSERPLSSASLPQPAYATVRNAERYAPALRQLQQQHAVGAASHKSLHDEVRVACALVHQPDGASARVDLDASRRPWLDALQQRCAGLPQEHLQPLPVDHPAQQAWRALVPANQASQAQALALSEALLRQSADASLLHEALRYRLAHARLPLARIFAGTSPPVRVDLEAAFAPAADLIACAHGGSCGSASLWTLYNCAQLGCPAGSDLDQALRWLLPKAQYENARRLAAWVLMGAPE